jgi:endonuclease/exonuclease/phosphatase (EEP) superfamily protein YafD
MSAGFALSACSAWLVAGRFFVIDLAVSYQHLLVLAVLVWAGVLVCLGRRWPGFVCLLAAAVGVMPLAAGRSVYLPGVDLEAPPAPGLVRVVSFNIGPLNERWEADYARALGVHADVVVLLEVPWVLSRPILRQGSLDGTGWSWLHRDWVADLASPCFLLSRWPMERVDLPEVEHSERDILLARIDHPAGQFLLAGAHPHSPRTVDRWVLGNTILGRTLDALESDRSRQGLALVLGTDINSAPTGSRARAARRSGLRMGKPLTGGVGSFPSQWPGMARVQLDDVWVAGGASVAAWSSVESLGSDHTMIVVDVRLPGAGTGRDSDMGE